MRSRSTIGAQGQSGGHVFLFHSCPPDPLGGFCLTDLRQCEEDRGTGGEQRSVASWVASWPPDHLPHTPTRPSIAIPTASMPDLARACELPSLPAASDRGGDRPETRGTPARDCILGMRIRKALAPSVEACPDPPVPAGSASVAGCDSRSALVSMGPEQRTKELGAILNASGKSCVPSKSFYQGSDSDDSAYWSVACTNGHAYGVQIPAQENAKARILSCDLMKAIGVECFRKLSSQ